MKSIALAAALSIAATAAFAGTPVTEPMMEPVVVEEQAAASSGGVVLPLVALLIIWAALQ